MVKLLSHFVRWGFALPLLLGCGSTNMLQPVWDAQWQSTAQVYATLQPGGWLTETHCDSVLFSGLLGSTPYSKVNLTEARDETGKWYRTPSHNCYRSGGSGSSTSADMMIGMVWWAVHNNRVDVIEDFVRQSQRTNWVIGEGDPGAVFIKPHFRRWLYEVLQAAGSDVYSEGVVNSYLWFPIPTGFQAHLQLLQIALLGKMTGELTAIQQEVIRQHYERYPHNPLYAVLHAKWVDASTPVPLKPQWYPPARLPRSADRCAGWLPERDGTNPQDYLPCSKGEQHTGGDLLFLEWLMEG